MQNDKTPKRGNCGTKLHEQRDMLGCQHFCAEGLRYGVTVLCIYEVLRGEQSA